MDDVEPTAGKIATPTSTRIARVFCFGLLGLVLAALVVATIEYEFEVLLTSKVPVPYPQLVYPLMAVPGTSPVPGAPGAAGADFSQVYTSALALRHQQSAYHPTNPQFADRFGRLANYPPLMNWIYVPLHTVVTLGMVPALIVWLEAGPVVPVRTKVATSTAFGLFLIVAFRLFGLTALGEVLITAIYLALALFFLAVCAYTIYIARPPRLGVQSHS